MAFQKPREVAVSARRRAFASALGYRCLGVTRTDLAQGTAKAEGDVQILERLAAMLVHFTPDFEMMPGTRSPAPRPELNPYEVGPAEFRGE